MKSKNRNAQGVSEVISVILIIGLLLILAMVVYALLFGSLSLKQTSRVAATGGIVKIPLDASTSTQILYAMPASGDKYYFKGQSNIPSGYPVASFVLRDPDGKTHTSNSAGFSAKANQYGTPVFLYQDRLNNYWVTDSLTSITSSPAQLLPLSRGIWTVTMIDNIANVPLTEMKIQVRSDSSTTNPTLPNYTPTCGGVNGAQGSGINNKSFNISCGTGPNGMITMHFNGFNSNMTIPNNPDLAFTGNMAISLWMRPADTGNMATPSNWHQILGKGSVSGATENDNYQLFQLGDKLGFEWNDAASGIHYQAITTSTPVSAANWNYVTVSVSGGTVKIFNNGVEQPLVYNQGVDPRSITAPIPNPPVVNLRSTANDVTVGKQNGGAGSEFWYNGDIGSLAVYNRALSTTEIQHNNDTYQA
jgi:hypothetical protein